MTDAEAYSLLAGVYDRMVVDPCHARWAEYLHELWSGDAAGVHTVLDVCCGTGLLAAELEERGYRVVGVDASAAMLALARERLGPGALLVCAALPDLPVDGAHDAAVSTFDGLNYLSPSDFRQTIAAVAARLRPGGWLVFDLHTDAMMEFTIAHPSVEGESDGRRFRIVSAVDRGDRTCETRIDLAGPAPGESFGELHRQWFHADADVRSALAAAGLALAAVTDEYTPRPAGAETQRATWIARRRL